MKGFMRQRGDAWELRVYLGRDPVTDKQRYATRTVRAGKRAAQRALATMVTEAERGLAVRTNSTVGELLEAWFDQAVRDFSPKTVKETRGFIARNLLPAIGDVPLTKLKASDLDRFYRQLQTSGGAGGRALSPATVRRIHGILRRALTQGVKWGWIGVNPAAATTPPRVPQKEIKPPSGSELAGVLKRAEETSPELACFLMLAAATGARRSELVALRWHDVDVAAGVVRIERGVVNGPDGLVEKDGPRRLRIDTRILAHRPSAERSCSAECRRSRQRKVVGPAVVVGLGDVTDGHRDAARAQRTRPCWRNISARHTSPPGRTRRRRIASSGRLSFVWRVARRDRWSSRPALLSDERANSTAPSPSKDMPFGARRADASAVVRCRRSVPPATVRRSEAARRAVP